MVLYISGEKKIKKTSINQALIQKSLHPRINIYPTTPADNTSTEAHSYLGTDWRLYQFKCGPCRNPK